MADPVENPRYDVDKSTNEDGQGLSLGLFAVRMRDRALVMGLKQAELSRATGISAKLINAYWNGVRSPGTDNLFPIAAALECDPEWLATGKGRANRSTIVIDGASADWVMLPRYDLAAFTADGKPEPIEMIPVAKHWLNRTWRYSTGLWVTSMPATHHRDLPAEEGDDIIVRDAAVRNDAGTYLYFHDNVPLIRRWTDSDAGWQASYDRQYSQLSTAERPLVLDEPPGMRIVGRILGAMKLMPF